MTLFLPRLLLAHVCHSEGACTLAKVLRKSSVENCVIGEQIRTHLRKMDIMDTSFFAHNQFKKMYPGVVQKNANRTPYLSLGKECLECHYI